MAIQKFEGAVMIRQRVMARYRGPLFDLVQERCAGEVLVVTGRPDPSESVATVDCLQRASWQEVKNVQVGYGTLKMFYQDGLLQQLEQFQPSVLVTEANPRFLDMKRVVRWMKRRNSPVLGWGIGTTNFFGQRFQGLRQIHRRRMVGRFDGMICYGSKAAEQYGELGFPRERIFVAYNATIKRPTRPLLHRTDKSDQTPLTLLSIGRLIKSKRVDLLIEAVADLQQAGHQVRLQVVGDGPDGERLRQVAAGREACVDFLGRVSGESLAQIGCQADLFVLPGLGGLAIQEAMSFGLPVIVSEADNTEIDLVTERNGWIVKKDCVTSLVDAISKAMRDRPALSLKGAESFRIVCEEINLERMADRFVDAIKRIVAMGKK